MNKLLSVTLLILLSGCVSLIKKHNIDSGLDRYVYECNSVRSKCLQKIAEHCQSNKFEIIKEEEIRKKSMNTTGMAGVSYKISIIFSCS